MPALVAFIRGINVGGHRSFRPSILAKELSAYDVVNVGATGTFVVRKPGSRSRFRSAVIRRLPFDAEIMLCDGRDLIRLEQDNPFAGVSPRADVVPFVSILSKAVRVQPAVPIAIPTEGDWYVRVLGARDRFVFGVYRRHMKTIGYLGQLDKLFGAPATTRGWSTILSIAKILRGDEQDGRS
jgi:uncharacterized protein (DUF1697 family)